MPEPLIPKEPKVPRLSRRQVECLTEIVFLEPTEPTPCDAMFVFAGTHPGHWQKAIEAYHTGLAQQVIVTGGVSPTGKKHPDWPDPGIPEADVIMTHLVDAGVKRDDIVFENRSKHTLENVLFAKEVFDFSQIRSLIFVCKSHAAGRQYRTLAQHLPAKLRFVPYTFDAVVRGVSIGRDNWADTEIGRARVFGEYLRMLFFGRRGDTLALQEPVPGLEHYR